VHRDVTLVDACPRRWREDESAAWANVQKGLTATSQNYREHLYLLAVAALYQDGSTGTKQSRDEAEPIADTPTRRI